MFPPAIHFALEILVCVSLWFAAATFGTWWAWTIPGLLSLSLVQQVLQFRRYGHRRL